MKKTKVLHVTHTDISSDSRIIKELIALRQCGFSLYGIGVELNEVSYKADLSFLQKLWTIRLVGRQLLLIPRFLRHVLVVIEFVLKSFFIGLKLRPDVVHCHDTVALPVSWLISVITRSALIYDAHELESDKNGTSFFMGRMTYLVERLLWSRVSGFITVSPSIEQWYSEHMGKKVSRVVLNSPIDSNTNHLSDNYLRSRFNIPEDELIFIYIGILGEGRGIDLILEAFQKTDLKSNVIFLGYGEFEEKITKLSAESGRVYFHEAVPHDEVVSIASTADLGLCLVENVSLSDYYCLPNKLFEYLFSGLRVVASDFPDIRNIVIDRDLGFCCDLKVDSLVENIKLAEKNIKNLENGKTINLDDLTWEFQAKSLVDLYTEILSV